MLPKLNFVKNGGRVLSDAELDEIRNAVKDLVVVEIGEESRRVRIINNTNEEA